MKKPMNFEYCASCGGELDTGWECNSCQRDWRPWAYPWWERLMTLEQRIAHERMKASLPKHTHVEPMEPEAHERYIESAEVRSWAKSGRELSREERRVLYRLQKRVTR